MSDDPNRIEILPGIFVTVVPTRERHGRRHKIYLSFDSAADKQRFAAEIERRGLPQAGAVEILLNEAMDRRSAE